MKKFQLQKLKIHSFITELENEDTETIKGGDTTVVRFSDLCLKSDMLKLCGTSHINCAIPK